MMELDLPLLSAQDAALGCSGLPDRYVAAAETSARAKLEAIRILAKNEGRRADTERSVRCPDSRLKCSAVSSGTLRPRLSLR
jgi:hypothetical protein